MGQMQMISISPHRLKVKKELFSNQIPEICFNGYAECTVLKDCFEEPCNFMPVLTASTNATCVCTKNFFVKSSQRVVPPLKC